MAALLFYILFINFAEYRLAGRLGENQTGIDSVRMLDFSALKYFQVINLSVNNIFGEKRENMREIKLKCPHCKKILDADLSVVGLEVACSICNKNFVAVPYSGESKKSSGGGVVKLLVMLVLALAVCGGGVFLYLFFTTATPESLDGNQLHAMTRTRANNGGSSGVADIARNDFFPVASTKKDFFYRDASFKSMSVGATKQDEVYAGEVVFMRNGVDHVRPVIVDRSKTFTHYKFPVNYNDKPDHLEGDGDLIFALARQIKKSLKEWKYVSGKAEKGGILVCTIAQGGNTETLRLQVEIVKATKDKADRVWVKILP